jgi:hypothetical protein
MGLRPTRRHRGRGRPRPPAPPPASLPSSLTEPFRAKTPGPKSSPAKARSRRRCWALRRTGSRGIVASRARSPRQIP